jgi:hypothetical protein
MLMPEWKARTDVLPILRTIRRTHNRFRFGFSHFSPECRANGRQIMLISSDSVSFGNKKVSTKIVTPQKVLHHIVNRVSRFLSSPFGINQGSSCINRRTANFKECKQSLFGATFSGYAVSIAFLESEFSWHCQSA